MHEGIIFLSDEIWFFIFHSIKCISRLHKNLRFGFIVSFGATILFHSVQMPLIGVMNKLMVLLNVWWRISCAMKFLTAWMAMMKAPLFV